MMANKLTDRKSTVPNIVLAKAGVSDQVIRTSSYARLRQYFSVRRNGPSFGFQNKDPKVSFGKTLPIQ
jgi:hypothetical protein